MSAANHATSNEELLVALWAILCEVGEPGPFGQLLTPFSTDSYLPPHLVRAAREAIENAPFAELPFADTKRIRTAVILRQEGVQ